MYKKINKYCLGIFLVIFSAVTVVAPLIPRPVYAQADSGVADSITQDSQCDAGQIDLGLGIHVPNPLGWFVCSVASMVSGAISALNTAIQDLFYFEPQKGNAEATLKIVWSSMLNIANTLFVIGLLIIIISQALDFSIFSDYTVKKMLPKLILGVVLANLSWSFTSIIIHLFNLLGNLAAGLFLSPISSMAGADNLKGAMTGGMRNILATVVGSLIIAVVSTGGAFLVAVIPIIIAGLIAILVAFLTLVIRRIIIVVLIVLAPIACAAWALPGGDKWFGKWWKLFMEMMIMYPMIQLFFAAGVLVAIISSTVTGGNSATGAIVGLIALLIPYGMLPMAFKMSSSMLGNLHGVMNQATQQAAKKRWSETGMAQKRADDKQNKLMGRKQRSIGNYLDRKTLTSQQRRDKRQQRLNKWANDMGQIAGSGKDGRKYYRSLKRHALTDDEKVMQAQHEQYKMRGASAENATVEMSKKSAELIAQQIAKAAAASAIANGGDGNTAYNESLAQQSRQFASIGDQIGFDVTQAMLANNRAWGNIDEIATEANSSPSSALGQAYQMSNRNSDVYSSRKALDPTFVSPDIGRGQTMQQVREESLKRANPAELASVAQDAIDKVSAKTKIDLAAKMAKSKSVGDTQKWK